MKLRVSLLSDLKLGTWCKLVKMRSLMNKVRPVNSLELFKDSLILGLLLEVIVLRLRAEPLKPFYLSLKNYYSCAYSNCFSCS